MPWLPLMQSVTRPRLRPSRCIECQDPSGQDRSRLKGENHLPKIVAGATFRDGTEIIEAPSRSPQPPERKPDHLNASFVLLRPGEGGSNSCTGSWMSCSTRIWPSLDHIALSLSRLAVLRRTQAKFPGGRRDCLGTGTADAVDSHCRDLDGYAPADCGLPRGVHFVACLDDVPHHHGTEFCWVEARAAELSRTKATPSSLAGTSLRVHCRIAA